jgi:pyridoxamine 5'-phosphate oxidase
MGALDVTDVDRDPIAQFERWFAQATAADVPEPNAMTLATCGADGRPSARIVLLKSVDRRGFVFYTDYRSRKAADLTVNPRAALVFLWKEIERQVRIEGDVTTIASDESEAYFRTRPLGSRFSAWASRQSAVIPDRDALDRSVDLVRARFPDGDVPLPEHWGGYRLAPSMLELWQGRPDRMHDRIRYRRDGETWVVERLSP